MKKTTIGLAGLGTIGTGLARLLAESSASEHLTIKTVLVRDVKKKREFLPQNVKMTDRVEDLIDDPEIDVIVELLGGVEASFALVSRALKAKKAVVTANKNLLAEKGPEIFHLAAESKVPVGLEASVCAGIPIIRTLQEALRSDKIVSIEGIVNGTTNYILTRMSEDRSSYSDALKEAQAKGFAEPDPDYDVSGKDAVCKAGILATLAFGAFLDFRKIPTAGIETLDLQDIKQAEAMGYKIKLVASARRTSEGRLDAEVGPVLLPLDHPLASIRMEYNAVLIESEKLSRTLYSGKGAGPAPTAVSLLADLLDIADGRALIPTANHPFVTVSKNLEAPDHSESRYYLRLSVPDRTGILAQVAGLFAQQKISLASVLQPEVPETSDSAPIILTTHRTTRGRLDQVLAALGKEGWGRAVVLRIQEN